LKITGRRVNSRATESWVSSLRAPDFRSEPGLLTKERIADSEKLALNYSLEVAITSTCRITPSAQCGLVWGVDPRRSGSWQA
jgi:hypothetical protein